jgi:hypothetical protein
MGPVVVAAPGDKAAALAELWQVRDVLADVDDCAAARVHALYNELVIDAA